MAVLATGRAKKALTELSKLEEKIVSLHNAQGRIVKVVTESDTKADEVKEKSKGLLQKLSLDWATRDMRLAYDKKQAHKRSTKESPYDVAAHCVQEKKNKMSTLRTGIALDMDEEVDDKTCSNKNRDTVISTFCNFRRSFESMLEAKGSKLTGREIWPNICCKQDNFENFKSCNDPSGKVKRHEVVPFAMSQGGALTKGNLITELIDMLRYNGYIHSGMKTALNLVDGGEELEEKMDELFKETSLCGPRTFRSPVNTEVRVCELFYPYRHLFEGFQVDFHQLSLKGTFRRRLLGERSRLLSGMEMRSMASPSATPSPMAMAMKQKSAKSTQITALEKNDAELKLQVETMKSQVASIPALKSQVASIPALKSQVATMKSQGATMNSQMSNLIKEVEAKLGKSTKLTTIQSATCPAVTFNDLAELNKHKEEFCTGYDHLDVANDNLINYAFVHIDESQISAAKLETLMELGRYEIDDDCPSKMFSAKDISIQNMDGNYMFIVQLDKTSPDGYLRKEVPMCGLGKQKSGKSYIPRTKISVKLYEDELKCCEETKDVRACESKSCEPVEVSHGHTKQQMEYVYDVKGTTYTVMQGHETGRRRRLLYNSRRRQLLQRGSARGC